MHVAMTLSNQKKTNRQTNKNCKVLSKNDKHLDGPVVEHLYLCEADLWFEFWTRHLVATVSGTMGQGWD